jgi:hypothetical protein
MEDSLDTNKYKQMTNTEKQNHERQFSASNISSIA